VYGPGLDEPLLAALSADGSAAVRAAATYYLGLQTSDARGARWPSASVTGTRFVRRRAAEGLVRSGLQPGADPPFDPVRVLLPLLGDDDRFVRFAGRLALERVHRNLWSEAALQLRAFPAATEALVALARTSRRAADVRAALHHAVALLESDPPPAHLAGLLRATHLLIVRDGGVPFTNTYTAIANRLLPRFPSGEPLADREIARTLAYLRTPPAVPLIMAALGDPSTSREQQIHYAYCLRVMDGTWAEADRQAIVAWFGRTQDQRWKGGASFDGYLRQMWRDVLALLPEAERVEARAAVPGLELDATGRPIVIQGAAAYSDAELREYLEFDPMAYSGDPRKGRRCTRRRSARTATASATSGRTPAPT
jgi:hypothetical protein